MGAHWRFDAIGTTWDIETDTDLPDDAQEATRRLIDEFDREWSRFRPDSLVSQLARGAGVVDAPADTVELLTMYQQLSDATGGSVNPLVGDSLAALGYDGQVSLTVGVPHAAPADWQTMLAWTGESLALSRPATIDIGAMGKGKLVDLTIQTLAAWTEGDVTVDASGDLATRGAPIRVGLEHPYDTSRAIGVITVQNEALCASATNRRAWGDGLHHVLDARTGQPVRTVAATWAVAPDAVTADAITTALFFEGGPELAHAWDVQWVRMLTNGQVEFSPRCPAQLFT
ncbi:FAD:protein FMN transferase [Microbacterium sp. NC79]|uniref:FAD:protein FMN transferase n=1 Tax=Microbacterium sp. NC79 TaxID=2851009 RepID=UPI001C2B9F0E|nr:FAD:protein FMN transferase [Microbacterium sp. NC79]MBV0894400.1 FAD:protein FMN transferase [Microbacterium sp. NC79]